MYCFEDADTPSPKKDGSGASWGGPTPSYRANKVLLALEGPESWFRASLIAWKVNNRHLGAEGSIDVRDKDRIEAWNIDALRLDKSDFWFQKVDFIKL